MRWHRLIGLLLLLPMMGWAKGQDNEIARYTEIIGTPEQPTIEGGLIQQAEKDESVIGKNTDKISENIDLHAVSKIPDEFSSDKNIKQLLTNAASDHKLAYVLQRANLLKLPATVALIPMVESHYQTDSVSPKGAKGAWQIMPDTAKGYGLTSQTSILFSASTDAALQLLKNLHQQFGHWTLAFAAYNAGSGRVMSALQHCPNAKFIDDLNLPLETKRYLHRLRSIYRIMVRLPLNGLA